METLQLDQDQETIGKLKYALSRQIPDMNGGFSIHTNYGDIEFDSEFAEQFQILAAVIFRRKLKRLTTY